MDIQLYHGCCFDVMPTIESGTIDMVCADIPYGTTQCKWDSVLNLQRMWEELYRVAKPEAAIVLFSAQPFTSVLVASNIRDWKTEWIWEKTHATGFLNAKRQPLRAHENIQVFYRKPPVYNPQMTHGHERKASSRGEPKTEVYGAATKIVSYDSTSRYPRDVQKFPSDKQKNGGLHPTQKPVSFVQYLIETYSNQGETVLDFTMGSGTAAIASKNSGRRFIGIERELQYYKIAEQRVNELGG